VRLGTIRSTLLWKLFCADNPVFANGSGYTAAAKLAGVSEVRAACAAGAQTSPKCSVALKTQLQSQNGRGWKGPLWVIQSNAHAEAGSPTAGCTGPCLGGSRISPEKENPQPLWAACSRALSPQSEEVLPHVQTELPKLTESQNEGAYVQL